MLIEADGRGELPAALARWVQQNRKSEVDWRRILARKIRQQYTKWESGKHDYSLRRPHRRQSIYHPFILPGLYGQPQPMPITCVVDTSGSIRPPTLTQILAEVEKIIASLNCKATVIPCDAKSYDPIPLKDSAAVRNIGKLQGGGGTNMVAGVEAALALKPTPALVVVFTDGHTPYPRHRYATPVIWALVESGSRPAPEPPRSIWPKEWVVKINSRIL
jgi:predicted metal-dependent peptidase